MATPIPTSNIKYEILQEDDGEETSEEGSEIIIITPLDDSSDHENDDCVLNIVITPDNNNTTTRDSNISAPTHLHHLTNNDNNITSSSSLSMMPALSGQCCASSFVPPPPPYEGAEAAPQEASNGHTITSLNLSDAEIQDEDLMALMLLSNYSTNNPKMSPRNGVVTHRQNTLGGGNPLPSYDVATDLPSYEEAERSKEEEMRQAEIMESQLQDEERNNAETTEHLTSMAIGTDWTFLCTFIISFLFNWIGFLLSLCITSTVSGRCGALSGLGLSVVKWVAIVKHSNWASGFAEEESWLWWSLMICGFLLFIRGCVQYIHIKYEWKKIAGRIQRFYFF